MIIEKIKNKIYVLEEEYKYYLDKIENKEYKDNWTYLENKMHDLRIEINCCKEILDWIKGADNKWYLL